MIILTTKGLVFNEVSKIHMISLHPPNAKRAWKLNAHYISNYTVLFLSNLWDLVVLKYDVINQNNLKIKDAAYRYHHNIISLTKELRLTI